MVWRVVLGVAIGATVLTGHAGIGAAAAPTDVIMMTGEVGQLPEAFRTDRTGKGAIGQWDVVSDPTAELGRALAQLSPDQTDYRFPLAIYQPISASNVEVTVRFKAMAGEVDRAGGIVVRFTDAHNYYVARANALEDNVNFYRVVRGVRQQIRGARTKVSSDEWHSLGLRATGSQFSVTFDGKTLFTAEDNTFPGPGKVGLWTKADSVTRFDSLAIHKLQ
jgi:Galactocerebrosidase, C-terminal lectin domain